MERGISRLEIVVFSLVALVGALAVVVGPGLGVAESGAGREGESAQIDTAISFDPSIECWYHDEFPQLDADFDPGGPFAQSRLYFRCTRYLDYFFVNLTSEGDAYRAVAPMAEEDCPEVEWYVEVIRPDFSSSRTVSRSSPVTSYAECRRRNPAVAFFVGDPELVVGTTGTALALSGFKTAGVASFITAAGEIVAAGGGGAGGLSTAAIAGIVAGGAGAAIVGATAGGGDEPDDPGPVEPPAPPPPMRPPPTPPPPPSPPTSPVTACIETRPDPPTIEAGERIEFDGRCSTGDNLRYDWKVLEEDRTRTGNFVSFRFVNPGIFTVELTVTDSSTALRSGRSFRGGAALADVVDTARVEVTVTEPPPVPLVACFTYTKTDPFANGQCVLTFDASCSEGSIISYEWILQAASFRTAAREKVVSFDLTDTGLCPVSKPFDVFVELTVSAADGRTDTISESFTTAFPLRRRQKLDASFTSYLGMAPFDGRLSGQVRHNEQRVDVVNNASTAQHRIQGRYGENVLEAETTSPTDGPGYWRFDFSGAANFVAGSIKPTSGQVLSMGARVVVFRLSGEPGERIRFTYQLLP